MDRLGNWAVVERDVSFGICVSVSETVEDFVVKSHYRFVRGPSGQMCFLIQCLERFHLQVNFSESKESYALAFFSFFFF